MKAIGSIQTLLVSMATTSYWGTGRYKLLPLSLSSSLRACPCPPSPSEAPIPAWPGLRVCNLSLVHRAVLRLGPTGVSAHRRVITAVARAEPDRLGEENAKQVFQNFEIGMFLNLTYFVFGCVNFGGLKPKVCVMFMLRNLERFVVFLLYSEGRKIWDFIKFSWFIVNFGIYGVTSGFLTWIKRLWSMWNFEENLEVLFPWVGVEKFGRLVVGG